MLWFACARLLLMMMLGVHSGQGGRVGRLLLYVERALKTWGLPPGF